MSFNSPSENYFQETGKKVENLSENQQRILDRVLDILEKDPELNKALHESFRKMTEKLLTNPEKFEALQKLIDANTQQELSRIESIYTKELAAEVDTENARSKAIKESKLVIQKATKLNLDAFETYLKNV